MVRTADGRHARGDHGGKSLYVSSGFFMLRAPVLHAHTLENLGAPAADEAEAPCTESSDGSLGERRAEGRRALLALAGQARVRQALHVASPALGRAVEQTREGEGAGRRKADRTYSALLRYLTRMSTRPTPYGLFAGVSAGAFTERTSVLLDDDPVLLTRTRADGAWLHTVMKEVEDDEKVRDRLPVRVNDLAYRAGGVLVLFRHDTRSGRAGDRVEIRLNRPVEAALDLAHAGPAFGELVAGLADLFPTVSQEKIRVLLNRLWELRILQSGLRPSLTEPVPEQYLMERLTRLDISPDVVLGLRETRRLTDEVDRRGGRATTGALEALSAHQRDLTPGFTGATYRQDTALAATAELSGDIASAAADAAETLMRLGCVRPRPRHIAEYHHRFLEHYGTDSELPLLDALRPETGLGPPNGYHAPPRQLPLPSGAAEPTAARDRALIELASHASRHGLREVELHDDWFRRLAAWSPDDPVCRPRTSLDLYFQLAAEGPRAMEEGDWRLVVGAFGYTGGMQGFGRFGHLLGEGLVSGLREHSRAEEELRPDIAFAELNYHPPGWAGSNVARHPGVRPYEIAVNMEPTLPPDRRIALEDILLGATATHFYLRSARLGRRLSVGHSHALSWVQAPNVCRALLEFSADGFTQGAMFDWGPLSEAPFLPRLTRSRTVVHLAKWTIGRTSFPDGDATADDFFHACRSWRETWNVPRYVYLTEFDNRLLLDLEHPLWVDELHREVVRRRRDAWSRSITLHEAYPGPRELWVRDRAGRPYHSEITVPLRLREPLRTAEPPAVRPPPVTRRWLPGDQWIHLKLYSAPDQHDAVIAGPLHAFVQEIRESGLIDRWFFIRYGDPLPHLRLRFRARRPDGAAELMTGCAAWGRGLVAAGLATDLAFTSYDREVERYGGPDAIDRLETVFFRNSDVSVDLVRLALAEPAAFDTEIICSASIHALYLSWGLPSFPFPRPRNAERKMLDDTRERFREIRPLLCEVLAPGEFRPDVRAAGYRAALEPILAQQHDAVREAGEHIRLLREMGRLTVSELNIIESLAHIQAIRLLGVDREREIRCRDLGTLALRAIRNRPPGGRSAPSG
ncbi:lantibiotic dehydratase [Actinomadura rugatobispora]|uniref:Lantibiotic dehydratase n=1 Tax=Actinomadura rugatobispora TaxID=1994 RepID=A0ABW0ZN91_9ACTN|nr:lantibiotic dehydratase [Actinomadura rugatobispora]